MTSGIDGFSLENSTPIINNYDSATVFNQSRQEPDISHLPLEEPAPRTMGELKSKFPEVYDSIIEQIQNNIYNLVRKQLADSQKKWKQNLQPPL